MGRKTRKKIILPEGCVGCHNEPAPKGCLGQKCKRYTYYHEGRTIQEKAAYIFKIEVASTRIGTLLGFGKRRKKRAA